MFKKTLIATIIISNLVLVAPVFAATPSQFVVACVQATVLSRENKLGTAIAAYTQAIQAAYAARNTALNQAYSGDVNNLKTAIKKAWTDFKTATKSATKTWKTDHLAAWKDFKTAVKNCKAPSSINDDGNSGLEVSGQ
jgi:hypothetical protein